MVAWRWYDWPFFSRRTGARWFLDFVPWRMRTWPGLRRYYWQHGEMAEIAARVRRYRGLFS